MTKLHFRLLWPCLLMLLLKETPVAASESSFTFHEGEVNLITSKSSLGLHFKLIDGWHIYWKNSGDSGAHPRWNWSLDGAKITAEHWPLPERITMSEIVNFGYSKESLFLFDFALNPGAEAIHALVDLEFLVCKIECIPYQVNLATHFSPEKHEQRFLEDARRFLYPRPAGNAINWVADDIEAGRLTTYLDIETQQTNELHTLQIFPEDGDAFTTAMPQIHPIKTGRYRIDLDVLDPTRKDFGGSKFLLVLENREGQQLGYEVTLQQKSQSFLLVLIWALFGGMILNLMPCVFPVLSIKILSFLGPNRSPRHLRLAGWFYTFGVLISFAFLSSVLLALRTAGEQIGWGFHLQSPVITASIAILFFWLGLNFLGFFEIGQSLTQIKGTQGSGKWSAFFTGVLATIVATPCTAPYMGAAIGASLLMPPVYTMVVFLALGAGMALPFLLLSYFPAGLYWMPKAGPWMVRAKEFLAFPLLATVFWLLWVLSKQIGSNGLLFLLAILLFIAWMVWLTRQLAGERLRQGLLLLSVLASIGAAAWLPNESEPKPPALDRWQAFSETVLQEHLKQGKAVFIDFTAAWCITCQVNKKMVLHTDQMMKIFLDQDIQLLQADWTNKDPIITKALAAFGRNSLPLYVFYPAGSKTPALLPEVLSIDIVLNTINKEKSK